MFPKYHLFFGAIFSVLLFILFPKIGWIGFLLILSSSVFIDVDHYLYYVFKKKDLNPRNATHWFYKNIEKYHSLSNEKKANVYSGIFFLHGFEAVFLLLIMSSHFAAFVFIMIGFIFHQILDFFDLTQKKIKPYKVLSFVYSIFDSRNKKLVEEI